MKLRVQQLIDKVTPLKQVNVDQDIDEIESDTECEADPDQRNGVSPGDFRMRPGTFYLSCGQASVAMNFRGSAGRASRRSTSDRRRGPDSG